MSVRHVSTDIRRSLDAESVTMLMQHDVHAFITSRVVQRRACLGAKVRHCKSQTPLHGHRLRTPATDTTNGQAHNNILQICHIARVVATGGISVYIPSQNQNK